MLRGSVESSLILLALLLVSPACHSTAPEHQVVVPASGHLEMPLGTTTEGRVHFYTYKAGGKNINFFVRNDKFGKPHTHFDACYSCFKYKLGYVQEGNKVVCIACRIGYDLDDPVWDFVGPCVPITLRSKPDDLLLVIREADLNKGERFF